jgi:hypothetical protein
MKHAFSFISCHKGFYNPEAVWGKMTHAWNTLVYDLVLAVEDRSVNRKGIQVRPSSASSQLFHLEIKHMKHWSVKGKESRCRGSRLPLPVLRRQQTGMSVYTCEACDIGLYISTCQKLYHANLTLMQKTTGREKTG